MTVGRDQVASLPTGPLPSRALLGARGVRIVSGMVAALAVLVHLPVLRAPFWFDDYSQVLMLEGRYPPAGHHAGPFDLFDFIDDANRAALVERGMLPWWSHPQMVVHFFRPLSSVLVWMDHHVLRDSAALEHAHSLVWWALASLAVGALLRQSFSPRVAWLGTVCFAFSPCHAIPLVWLANRSALVSVALGAVALAAYARWRSPDRRPRDGVVSLVFFALALAAGEYALCFGGYVVAIEVFKRRESLTRRALGLAAFVLPAAAYLAAYAGGRFGAHGSGFYRDPLRDFGAFVTGAPRDFAALACSAWIGLDGTWWETASGWTVGTIALLTLGLLAVPVALTIRGLEPAERERASWMLVGSLLALGPVLSVAQSTRVLGIAMIGVSALVGLVVDRGWFLRPPGRRSGVAELTGIVALGLGFVHLVRGPLDSWVSIRATIAGSTAHNERIAWIRDHADGKTAVVILRADYPSSILFAPVMLDGLGPASVRTLTYASGKSLLLRTAPGTIEMVSGDAPLFPVGPGDMFRNFDFRVHRGETVKLGGMRATILQLTDQGAAHRIRFEFDRDLDDPGFLFLVEGDKTFREQKLPEVGYGEPINP